VIKDLPNPCKVKGFDGKEATPITQYTELMLLIDRRRLKIPFLIVGLGDHDLILGRKWAAHIEVLIDCKNRCLKWPAHRPAGKHYGKIIATSKSALLPATRPSKLDKKHQRDADRRDAIMTLDSWRPKILKRGDSLPDIAEPPATPSLPASMRKESSPNTIELGSLSGAVREKVLVRTIDIAQIGAAAFRTNLRKKENILFQVSLYDIEREMQRRDSIEEPLSPEDQQPGEAELEWLQRVLPPELREYADVFSKEASNELPPRRFYDHKIQIDDPKGIDTLGYSPLRHQSTEELLQIKSFLEENLQRGFIEASQAPYSSPTLFVKKPNGGLRFCIDYRKLNELTRKDRYPIPLIDETLARLAKAKIYTKLDIRQAFHRIRMDPDSEELTTFRTRYGAYKCKVLWEGLTNGPATYQRYMNDTLFDYLDDFCTVYLDDILIYSEDVLEHDLHVRKVLDRLRAAGLQVDIKKSEFRVTRTKYLGFIISTDGICIDPSKVEVVKNWQRPTSVKGVQSFLGFCNFCRRFIKAYGRIAKPLTALTRKGTPYKWTEQTEQAFQALKDAMTSAPVLRYFSPTRATMVETDASDGVIAGVLYQQDPETSFWHPVAYFSKTMEPAQLNYDIHDKEMLAIVKALREWRAELEGIQEAPFMIYSDHRALVYFMTTKELTSRQARWAELLSRYNFKLMYRAGKANARADALSRREDDVQKQNTVKREHRTQALLPTDKIDPRILEELQLAPIEAPKPLAEPGSTRETGLETPTSFPEPGSENEAGPEGASAAVEQEYDSIQLTDRILQENRVSPDLAELRTKAQHESEGTWQLRDGLLLRYSKLYVTDGEVTPGMPLRTAIIREAHDQPLSGHPGRSKLRQLLQARYYWPNQGKDIDQYCANCHTCRRAHVPRDKKPGLLHPLPVPERPWQHITVDFKHCPESKAGHNMIALFVDRLGKRPITIPVRDTITAKQLVPLFLLHVVRHVGIPDTIVSDRGPQFVSDFWHEFCTRVGTKLKLSTANHPQTDGQTEIVNQYFDQRLRPYVNYYQDDWDEWVAIVDYQQSSLWHETTGQSPFMTEKGYEARTSFDWETPVSASTPKEQLNRDEAKALVSRIHSSWEAAQGNMARAQERYTKQANKHRREVDFTVGDKVWITTKHWKTDRPSHKLAN